MAFIHTTQDNKKFIVDIYAEAKATVRQMGPNTFTDKLHSRETRSRTEWKEIVELRQALELGQFAQVYNQTKTPKLIYARANAPKSGGADFTVWDETLSWSRDLELTSVWGRKEDFPRYADKNHPGLTHIDLQSPRQPLEELRCGLTKHIKKVLHKHVSRTNYPPYWLAIYVNGFHWYEFPLDYVANTVSQALVTKSPSTNVEQVWVWDSELLRAFPA